MSAEIPEDHVTGRAVPLPEERDGEGGGGRAAAEEILRDSEQRMADAVGADAPGDAADEHRRGEDTVTP